MVQTKVTIREVAERAGFSTTTVSHVLNNVPGKRIPDSTRTLVKAAADDLGYRPNRLAQGLRLQRSDTIGFVSDRIATSPHAGMTIVGAQRAAAEYGSLLLLMNSGTDADLEQREIRALLDRQVDGIVYAAEYHRLVNPPALLHETHAVLLDARPAGSDWAYAVPDEFGGAVTAMGALIESGHRRIGHVTNVDDIPATIGLRIPEDLSIVGFDDQQIISAGLRPGLTTVALPHLEMGEWAVHALMRLIHSDGQETVEPAVLPCPLVRRASVGPPPGV